jgi:hypothetical protein
MMQRESQGAVLTGMNISAWEPLAKKGFVQSFCIRDFQAFPVYAKHQWMIGAVMLKISGS